MPPPPTLASPPMQRPGVREITDSGQKLDRPGLVQRSGTQSKLDEMAHPDDETKVVEKLKPEPGPSISRATLADIPPHGSRIPRCGDHVIYWQRDLSGKIIEYPAQLIWWNSVNRKWALNLHQVGRVQGRHEITFSETPADCCWTWPEGKVSTGDALATAESAFEMCANLAQEIAVLKDKMAAMQRELADARNEMKLLLVPATVNDPTLTGTTVSGPAPVRLPPAGKVAVTPKPDVPKAPEGPRYTDGSL